MAARGRAPMEHEPFPDPAGRSVRGQAVQRSRDALAGGRPNEGSPLPSSCIWPNNRYMLPPHNLQMVP